MFASAQGSTVAKRQAGAYRQMLVATGVNSASPHGLIGMLYDGLLAAIAEARGAMRSRDIPAKGKAISRAVRIVDEGLSAALNLQEGGNLATDLRSLYTYINLRLTHANLKNDEAALDECVQLTETLRSAWAQIADRAPA
jgi:flagellar secretion chaperone FliS